MEIISIIKDYSAEQTSKTYSVLTEIPIREFQKLLIDHNWTEIDEGLGQRKFIEGTHKSKLIKSRLQKDIKNGAVLPPIVMGFVCPEIGQEFDNQDKDFIKNFLETHYKDIFILDGVQRCTNIASIEEIAETTIRVEWWITDKVDSALDRMLILNFAQTPWSIKQQGKAINILFGKTGSKFKDFSNDFESDLDKAPHKFLECLFSFQKRRNDVFIKDEISSVFLQEYDVPNNTLLQPFGVTYRIACLWSKYLLAEHSVRIGICLALADIIYKSSGQLDADTGNKIIAWSKNFVEALGKPHDPDNKKEKQNYLDSLTLKKEYEKIDSAIAITSREMFRIAFTEIFNNILKPSDIWKNPTLNDDTKYEIMGQFGGIWERAYTQVGRIE